MYINIKEDSELYSTIKKPRIPWDYSKQGWEILNERTIGYDVTQTVELKIQDQEVSLIDRFLDADIWRSLPLQEHKVMSLDANHINNIKNAMEYLMANHDDLVADLWGFLKTICFLSLREERKEDSFCITSVSIPALPFASFFSSKALVHIPPSTVIKQPMYVFLAENIYHEMIHNRMNLNLLEKEFFTADYDSATSERIEIPWRPKTDPRNHLWEIDRVVHAISVYAGIIPFRIKELKYNKGLSSIHKEYKFASEQAIKCAQYLGKAINDNNSLTDLGKNYLHKLNESIEENAGKIGQL
jgi:hypothetical protein